MDLTWAALTVAGLLSVAGLPFVMAKVEQSLMTSPRVTQPPR